jgi:hypothetical protein
VTDLERDYPVVGRKIAFELLMDLDAGDLRLAATAAKIRGRLDAEFTITPDGETAIVVLGGERTGVGTARGALEGTVRDKVILPVFIENLVPLLEK